MKNAKNYLIINTNIYYNNKNIIFNIDLFKMQDNYIKFIIKIKFIFKVVLVVHHILYQLISMDIHKKQIFYIKSKKVLKIK